MYAVKFTSAAVADVKAIPKNIRNSLKKALRGEFTKDSFGCSKELREPLEGFRSFHWESYRVVFMVDPDLEAVVVAGVGLRSPESAANVYRKLELLAATGKLAEQMQRTLFGIKGYSSRE